MSLLKEAYFPNKIAPEEIPYRNIDFISDMSLVNGILKAVIHQTNANNNNYTATSSKKNTFLFR